MKNALIGLIVLIILAVAGYFIWQFVSGDGLRVDNRPDTESLGEAPDTATGEMPSESTNEKETELGKSVEGRSITAYHYGSGETELLFVGGIHGGYSWNTALVAYELVDYLEANPDVVPENVRVTVVPVLNPDGLYEVVGKEGRFTRADVPSAEGATVPGRFNANEVDLNRNFDCDWQENAKWQSRTVSGGTRAFSEPESQAIRDYIGTNNPTAVVVWYSAAGGVFSSNCHNGVLPKTAELTEIYADASGYRAFKEFNFYEITGDMVNWLAKERIPGISVLLTNHRDVEWEKNRKGIEALLNHYKE